jgi:hypothetical protein
VAGLSAQDSNRLASWRRQHAIAPEIANTPGYADQRRFVRLAHALNPRIIVSIHTETPEIMDSLLPNVRIQRTGIHVGPRIPHAAGTCSVNLRQNGTGGRKFRRPVATAAFYITILASVEACRNLSVCEKRFI